MYVKYRGPADVVFTSVYVMQIWMGAMIRAPVSVVQIREGSMNGTPAYVVWVWRQAGSVHQYPWCNHGSCGYGNP